MNKNFKVGALTLAHFLLSMVYGFSMGFYIAQVVKHGELSATAESSYIVFAGVWLIGFIGVITRFYKYNFYSKAAVGVKRDLCGIHLFALKASFCVVAILMEVLTFTSIGELALIDVFTIFSHAAFLILFMEYTALLPKNVE